MGRFPLGPPGGRPPGRGVGGRDKSLPKGYIFIEYDYYNYYNPKPPSRWAGGIRITLVSTIIIMLIVIVISMIIRMITNMIIV